MKNYPYNYHIVSVEPNEDDFNVVIGDGYDTQETLYQVRVTAEELNELEFYTNHDLYQFVRNNDCQMLN